METEESYRQLKERASLLNRENRKLGGQVTGLQESGRAERIDHAQRLDLKDARINALETRIQDEFGKSLISNDALQMMGEIGAFIMLSDASRAPLRTLQVLREKVIAFNEAIGFVPADAPRSGREPSGSTRLSEEES
jgi:hypothetical protein